MILYLDASALVKRYIVEPGTPEIASAIIKAEAVGTSLISRAETAAAMAKAVRAGTLNHEAARSALQVFRSQWPRLVRIQATEALIGRADEVAWEFGLRGYDAVHLASALLWRDGLGREVTMATFDQQLWVAASKSNLTPFPGDLSTMIAIWRRRL